MTDKLFYFKNDENRIFSEHIIPKRNKRDICRNRVAFTAFM